MKKVFKISLLIVWMIVIFQFSNQSGSESLKMSDGILTYIAHILSVDATTFVNNFSYILRKGAHFSEYFILYILIYEVLKEFHVNKRIFIYSFIFCIVCAIFDETHQLFIDGRSGMFLDVIIDCLGSVCSYFFYHRLLKR